MESLKPCCCCLLRPSEKDLKTPYLHLGITEIFSKMLEDCFQIHLTLDIDNDYGICEECAGRLRDASDFKLQVQHSQAELQVRMRRALHVKGKEPMMKLEILDDNSVNREWTEVPILRLEAAPVPDQPAGTSSVRPEGRKTFDHEPSLATHNNEVQCTSGVRAEEASTSATFEMQFAKFCLNNKQKIKRTRSHRNSLKDEEIICQICGQNFARRYGLRKHMDKHAGSKCHVCKVCGKRFTYIDNLRTHERTHTEDLPYICDICNKRYLRKCEIREHMKSHIAKRIKCDICDKDFVNKNSLENHKIIHSDKRPFACDVCRKRFRRKEHLRVHNRIHTGERPYSCELCEMKFFTQSLLKRHKKVHKNDNLSAVKRMQQ